MAEFRYNPLIGDWTIVAGHRQNRPDMPKDYCAFCPGSGRVPDNYTVMKYDNDWPSMMPNPPEPDDVATDFYKVEKAYGKAEVILYSPDHNKSLWQLPVDHINELVHLWKERHLEIKKDINVKSIFPFENRGKEVGTTQPHPHGQIYGYGFIPLRLKLELEKSKEYYENTGKSLIESIRDEEIRDGRRIVMENDDFVVFLPFYTDYPYGCYIVSKRNGISTFEDFDDELSLNFAKILKSLLGTFDELFDRPFPYMMGIYQAPVNLEDEEEINKYYNFNVKFFPPLRAAQTIRWNASSETAMWARTNPKVVEQTTLELREAYERYKEKYDK